MSRIMKQIKSWSFSRYMDWRQCPQKAKFKHLDKIQEPPNDAMDRGIKIHKMAEDYIKGTIKKLPNDLVRFKDEFDFLRKDYKKKIQGAIVEDTWAFTNEWDLTVWNDWIKCWVRIKIDCAHYRDNTTLYIKDWKTGKYREDSNDEYMMQMELYALGALLMPFGIEKVIPQLKYLDHGITFPPAGKEVVYTRADLPKLMKTWEKRVKPMLAATTFPPKPNDKCRFCHYRKSNKANGGGQCQY